MQLKTLSPSNQAIIVCPIFNAETQLSDCFALEQQLAKGLVQTERRGCQACLRSSKCPIYWINRDLRSTSNTEDPYHSSEPKVLSLKAKHLDAIRPVIVRGETMDEFQVTSEEREAMLASNEAASAGAKARSGTRKPAVKLADVQVSAPRPPKASTADDGMLEAAVSGDMSAAITKATAKAAQKPAEPAPAPVAPSAPEPARTPPAPKPAPAITAPAPASAGKGKSLLEMARARAAKAAA